MRKVENRGSASSGYRRVSETANADLTLIKLPADKLLCPAPGEDLAAPRDLNAVTRTLERHAAKSGFDNPRFSDFARVARNHAVGCRPPRPYGGGPVWP